MAWLTYLEQNGYLQMKSFFFIERNGTEQFFFNFNLQLFINEIDFSKMLQPTAVNRYVIKIFIWIGRRHEY